MKTIKKIARDLLGLVAGDPKVGEGTVQLGRALLSSTVTAAFLAVTVVERQDGIAVLALFFPMVAACIWAVVMWDNYLHGKPQAVEATEKATPKNPSEASEVKEGRAQEPAVETPQAPETSTAEEAVEAGKENPVTKPTTSGMGVPEGEKATPEKTTRVEAMPSIDSLVDPRNKTAPKKKVRKDRPEGAVDIAHEWPGVSDELAAVTAVLRGCGAKDFWVPKEELNEGLRSTFGDYLDEEVTAEDLAAIPEENLRAIRVIGGLCRQARMMQYAIIRRVLSADRALQECTNPYTRMVLQSALNRLDTIHDDVQAACKMADRAANALECPIHIYACAASIPETAFGVEESITFARNVLDKFGAGREQEAAPEPPAPKPQPVSPPRVRHPKPTLGDVKDTRKNQAAGNQPVAGGEAPTLANLWPDLTGQGKEGQQ